MRSPGHGRSVRCIVAGAAAFALAACGQPIKPGVTVQQLETDVAFGQTEPAEPPSVAPPAAPVEDAGSIGDDGELVPPPSRPKFTGPVSVVTPCPAAPSTGTAKEPAGFNVPIERRAQPGKVRFRVAGVREVLPGLKVPVQSFESRLVRNVVRVDATTSTYETVRAAASGRFVVTTWQVKANPTRQDASNQFVPLVVGEPERGVVLKSQQIVDAQGTAVAEPFTPLFGLLVLPLPVFPGEQWQSAAVDPATGSTVQFSGQVTARTLVDACGELIDGWVVTGTQVASTSAASTTETTELVIAPQLGGIIVREHVVDAAGTYDLTATRAQLEPTPVGGGSS